MRVLGIDYGQKHIGLAVGDTDLRIATPLKEVETAQAVLEIHAIIRAQDVTQIVIGLPLSFRMEETEASTQVRLFGATLEKNTGLSVAYENEILTSSQIEKEGGGKSHASSAALILQSWLERQYN
ncbi:MAG: Holliday junction resolvase RuvX [Parcubacteria group bacterium]|nr:Holliday junction resolvase RuvX [Parcubacteria group bacterium]